MNIKQTLIVGTGTLFVLIVIVSIVGISTIYMVKQHTAAIVQANHASISYMHRMLKNIEKGDALSLKKFERDLQKQMGNIPKREKVPQQKNYGMIISNIQNIPKKVMLILKMIFIRLSHLICKRLNVKVSKLNSRRAQQHSGL